jgi:glycosyltransferase involved in cell wall biosynthesis
VSHTRWTVLSIGYPFAAVGPGAAGGAERVLAMIDRGLVTAGHASVVVAPEGSRIRGRLVEVPGSDSTIDREVRKRVHAHVRAAVAEVLRRERVDVVHMHGVDFHAYAPVCDVPVLVTLHLPVEEYPSRWLREYSAKLHLHCVSWSQHRRMPADLRLLPPIANGIELDEFRPVAEKGGYALVLGRICEDKGQHLAMDAAKLAGVPLLLAGRVYPYPEHLQYFGMQVEPRLDAARRFVGPASGTWLRNLLARARCLVVPSLVHETSSLVAMEALASGTPVVAMRRGALVDVVDDGMTGFLADDVEGLAEGIRNSIAINPARCRDAAVARHDARRMLHDYFAIYAQLGARSTAPRIDHAAADQHPLVTE